MDENIGIIIFFITVCVGVGLVNQSFWTFANLINLLRSISFTCIVGVGMTMIIIHGGIDLSVGSVIGLGHMVTGVLLREGLPVPVAIILGISSGTLLGLSNGIVITKYKIPALITTLGSLYIARGIVYVLTQGRPVYPFPDVFNAIGTQAFWGIPYSVYLMVIVIIIGHILLNHTVYGRHLFAIGGNEETTRISGINVNLTKIVAYGISGTLAALVGMMMAARMNSSIPNAGEGWEMRVIASVIIGGTSLFGGSGSIFGTLIGASIMSVLSIAMVMLNINVYWQNIVIGFILIGAVGFDQLKRSLSNRVKLSVH
jgi:ribose/xylose/arabinose/galactoside ABC-type transport system permease subunit